MTREALGWLFVAACFTAAGYMLARAVDAARDHLVSWEGGLTSGWWDQEDDE